MKPKRSHVTAGFTWIEPSLPLLTPVEPCGQSACGASGPAPVVCSGWRACWRHTRVIGASQPHLPSASAPSRRGEYSPARALVEPMSGVVVRDSACSGPVVPAGRATWLFAQQEALRLLLLWRIRPGAGRPVSAPGSCRGAFPAQPFRGAGAPADNRRSLRSYSAFPHSCASVSACLRITASTFPLPSSPVSPFTSDSALPR